MPNDKREYDYIIVGSGAGGGPLAANLAEAGHEVLLIEAGGEDSNDNYSVPAFHPLATEDEALEWRFFCRHYTDDDRARLDPKHRGSGLWDDGRSDIGGIHYPRAGTLGGCTAHHAMITVYPHNFDFDGIAYVTGDDSWRSDNMRRYFERVVKSQFNDASDFLKFLDPRTGLRKVFRRIADLLDDFEINDTLDVGWLTVNQADFRLLGGDKQLLKLIASVIVEAKKSGLKFMPALDPNVARVAATNGEGINLIPISTDDGKRTGTRERINAVRAEHPNKLTLATHTLVTRVLLDDGEPRRALGVEVLHGKSLYEADPRAGSTPADGGVKGEYRARREVILAGGAFNTPQLLMLSGIGPARHLRDHGIEVRIPLEGVGQNLQDRYEVGVVYEMEQDHKLLADATFADPAKGHDKELDKWRRGEGVYVTNGAVLGIIKRSKPDKREPDLYIFGVPGDFRGYYPGYSRPAFAYQDRFTWAVLKGHTKNRGGEVRLRSSDPLQMPEINFHYFDEGSGDWQDDLESLAAGVEFVQQIMGEAKGVKTQLAPKPEEKADLSKFVAENAWGHHASCTCQIGPREAGGVLDSRFKVHGTSNLRVVDASVFPRIPGLFILSSVYMISEKASDVILEDAKADR